MKRIYISGPMTGVEDLNREAFNKASSLMGNSFSGNVCVFDPHHIGAYNKWDEKTSVEAIAKELLDLLTDCDAIYMLRGWESSKGARAEHAVAVWIGLEIIYQGGEA